MISLHASLWPLTDHTCLWYLLLGMRICLQQLPHSMSVLLLLNNHRPTEDALVQGTAVWGAKGIPEGILVWCSNG